MLMLYTRNSIKCLRIRYIMIHVFIRSFIVFCSTFDFLKEQAQRQRAEQARQSQEEKDHYKEHSRISIPLFPEPPRVRNYFLSLDGSNKFYLCDILLFYI